MNTNKVIQVSVGVAILGAMLMILRVWIPTIPWVFGIGLMMIGHLVYAPLMLNKNLDQGENEKNTLAAFTLIDASVALLLAGLIWFYSGLLWVAIAIFVGLVLVYMSTELLVKAVRADKLSHWHGVSIFAFLVTFGWGVGIYLSLKLYTFDVLVLNSAMHLFTIIMVILFCISVYSTYKGWLDKK